MRKPLLALMLFSLSVSIASAASNVVEEIVARVNNQIITRSEYDRSKEQTRQEAQKLDPVNGDKLYAEREKDVLRGLIDQQLLLERGKEMDITGDTDLVKRLDQMRKEMNLKSMEDLEDEARKQGVVWEDFKQNMKNQIITQTVIGREVGSRMSLTKEEKLKFYEEHKKEMMRPEEIRLREILVSITGDDPVAISAAQTKAEGLLAEIRKGTSYEDIAKKNSNGPTAAQGGDLGYFKRGVLAKELEEKTFAMKAGDVSDPIRTRQGWVILKVVEHHDAGIPTFEEAEPRIEEEIYAQRMEPALRAYLTHLREDAYIDVRPGYVDTGASPNQTKPVETSGKEANAKTLKKKKKMLIF